MCNTIGANPWFNLPYHATDNYLIHFAEYVRDHLRPDVTIYVEIGNECWGSGDPHLCGNYAQKMGYLENLQLKARKNYYSSDLVWRVCYHAKTGHHYAAVITQILGENRKDKFKLVLNTQAAWGGPLEVFFLCEGDFYTAFSVVAIAPYMSVSLSKPDKSLVSLDEFYNQTFYAAISDSVNLLIKTAALVNSSAPNMSVSLYEAGPDFSSLTDTANTALTNLSLQIHRDPRMYDAFKLYLTNITRANGVHLRTYNHFTSTGVYSKYGCWGLSETSISSYDESPKLRAYQDFINSERICKWVDKESFCEKNCSNSGYCVGNEVITYFLSFKYQFIKI